MWRDHIRNHPVLAGAVAGFVWGIVARLWMRFISDQPEFSWSGTGFIVGAATIVGTALGLAWLRRSRGGRGWWRLWGLAVLSLGMGAGSIMIPTVIVGAVALGRPWRGWIKAAVLMVALVPQALVLLTDTDHMAVLPRLAGLAIYVVLLGIETAAASIVFRPRIRAVAEDLPVNPPDGAPVSASPSVATS